MSDNCFRLIGGELCELGHGPHTWCAMIDFFQNGSRDIVISVPTGTLNAGNTVYLEHSSTKGVANSVPVYDFRDRLQLSRVNGMVIASIDGTDGLYDLLVYDNGTLKRYINSGKPGKPCFDGSFQRITVNGTDICENFKKAPISHISVFDDENGHDHLVISCNCNSENYWPAGFCPRDEGEHPTCGFNRGYDENGKWLGKKRVNKIFVVENSGKNGLSYGKPFEIYRSSSLYSVCGCAIISEGSKSYLCFNKSLDSIYQAPYKNGKLEGPAVKAACSPLKNSYMTSLATADVDNDGNDEIIFGSNPGLTFWMDLKDGIFTEKPAFKAYNGYVWGESLSVPCVADFDNDGDNDLVLGDASGYLWYFENVSSKRNEFLFKPGVRLKTSDNETIHQQGGYRGSIQGPAEARWGYLKTYAIDWDNDGLIDIITNNIAGEYLWYKNIGDKKHLVLAPPVSLVCNGKPFKCATRARPGVWSDGSLVMVNVDGYLQFYHRDREDPRVILEGKMLRYRDGGGIKVSGSSGYSGRTVIYACDWDEDGRTDLLGGTLDHNMRYVNRCFPNSASPFFIKNIGSDDEPVFERPVLITRSDGAKIGFASHECSVWAVDIDGDGRLDLINGAEDGRVYYWRRDMLKWDWDCAKDFTGSGK